MLVADDEALLRTWLRERIDDDPGFHVVGEAENGAVAVERAFELDPDIVLMDIRMPGMDGVEATRQLYNRNPERPRVVVVTVFQNDRHIAEAVRAGASGYLLKRLAWTPGFVHDLRSAASGESVVLPESARRLVEYSTSSEAPNKRAETLIARLSVRETDVLRLAGTGLRNGEIAVELFLSENTVKKHMNSIFKKLEGATRAEAASIAYEGGLLVPGSTDDRSAYGE